MEPDTETRQSTSSGGAFEREALSLYLMTGLLLIATEAVLSRSWIMTAAALKLYGLVLLLVCSAGHVWRRGRSMEMSTACVVVYLVLAVWLRTQWLIVPLIPLSFLFLKAIDKGRVVKTLFAPRVIAGAAVAAAVVLSVMHYADFLLLEKATFSDVHQDTLFHASVAAMIKTYGVVSTGLNGLVPLQYHALSHRLMGGLSVLSGVPVLETYGVAAIVFLAPLLIFAVTWCASRLSPSNDPLVVVRHWLFVCAVFILVELLPVDRLALWDSYLLGDSYSLSLVLLVLAIPALANRHMTFAACLGAAALIVLAGLSKGSMAVIGLGLLWAKLIVLPGDLGRRKLGLIVVASTGVFVFFMGSAAASQIHDPFNPFFYAQRNSQVYGAELREAVSSLLLAHVPPIATLAKALVCIAAFGAVNWFFCWVVTVRRVAVSGWKAALTHEDALFSLVAVGIALATMMFKIIGGWDFINPPMFVALPFVAVIVNQRFGKVPLWASVPVTALFAAAVLVIGYRSHLGIFVKTQSRMQQHRRYGPAAGREIIPALLAVRDAERGRRVIFERDASFPRPPKGFLYCAAVPFLYPAFTERAWVGLIEPESDCPYENYGYPPYFTGPSRALVPPVIPPGAAVVAVPRGAGASAK